MHKFRALIILLFASSFFYSCSEGETEPQVKLPDNLVVTVEYLANGVVKANFKADNAAFFKVNFGTPGETAQRVDGNTATKT
ncbi:MAG: hypothetical protein RLZZ207_637, partial [Bacteroidota bacterium]